MATVGVTGAEANPEPALLVGIAGAVAEGIAAEVAAEVGAPVAAGVTWVVGAAAGART